MQNVTYLVHGILTADKGSSTIMQVAPYIAPYTLIRNHSYGKIGPICAVRKNKGIAKRLALSVKIDRPENTAFAIGHSNGCAIIIHAIRQGAKFKSVLLINPALNIDLVFPPGDYTVTVVHTRHDSAVKAARFFDGLPLIGALFPDIWGAMGAYGYTGDDPRVLNLDYTELSKDHSHIFEEEVMSVVGNQLAAQLYPEALA